MTPPAPLCQDPFRVETFRRVDPVCEARPRCSEPVPTLVEDEGTQSSYLIYARHCSETFRRMSPTPEAFQRLVERLNRRSVQIPVNPPPAKQQNPAPSQAPVTPEQPGTPASPARSRADVSIWGAVSAAALGVALGGAAGGVARTAAGLARRLRP